MMRMMFDGFIGRAASLGSPGVNELRWLAPLRPGDDVTLDVEVTEARVSKSRPETGIVTFKSVARNAAGTGAVRDGLADHHRPARRGGSGLMRFFEDMAVGDRRETGSFTFTADEIKRFARQYDPQRFHLSEEEGRNSLFGGLAASGWHVAAVYMGLLVLDCQRNDREALARGDKVGVGGPSPGFRDLRWIKPVLAGDTITFVREIETASAPPTRVPNGASSRSATAAPTSAAKRCSRFSPPASCRGGRRRLTRRQGYCACSGVSRHRDGGTKLLLTHFEGVATIVSPLNVGGDDNGGSRRLETCWASSSQR